MSERYAYILPIEEKWWNRLCNRSKAGKTLHVFVRKGVVGPTDVTLVLFYVKHPSRKIRGFGEFVVRVTGDVNELWNTYGQETCLNSYEEYVGFMQGRAKATFIVFKNLRELSMPVSVKDIYRIIGINRMPRGGKYINTKEAHRLIPPMKD